MVHDGGFERAIFCLLLDLIEYRLVVIDEGLDVVLIWKEDDGEGI